MMAQPLNDMLKGRKDSKEKLQLNSVPMDTFKNLKQALCHVPALGITDTNWPFILHAHERDKYMTTVLTQEQTSLILFSKVGWSVKDGDYA